MLQALEHALDRRCRADAVDAGAHEGAGRLFAAVAAHRSEDVLAGQEAGRLPERVDHRKFVLRRRKQRVDRLSEIGVDRDRGEARLHGVGDAEPFQRLLRRAHLRFAGRGHVDEDRDEDEERIAEQAEKAEAEGEGLADLGGDVGRARSAEPHRQQGMQNPPAVHRKGGDEVEHGEKDVGRGDPADQRQAGIVDLREQPWAQRAQRQGEREADDEIDGGPGERDDQLLARGRGMLATPPIGSRVTSGDWMP